MFFQLKSRFPSFCVIRYLVRTPVAAPTAALARPAQKVALPLALLALKDALVPALTDVPDAPIPAVAAGLRAPPTHRTKVQPKTP